MVNYFSSFLRYAMKTVVIFICIFTILIPFYFIIETKKIIFPILTLFLLILTTYIYIKDRFNIKTTIFNLFERNITFYILVLAFALRLMWVLLVPSKPESDFALMYNTAASVAQGHYQSFHGTAYFARFAHDTITVLYFSLFYNFSNSPLLLIKILNIFFQTFAVYAMYLLINELYKDKKVSRYAAFFMAIFPPYIMYCSQVVSENMAVHFYLLSVYYFFKSLHREKNYLYPLLAGLFLSVGNLFRMIGIVFIIAYLMYTLLYKGFKDLVRTCIPLVIAFLLPLLFISNMLFHNNITDTQLWNSKEPYHTSILKGTNIKFLGRWNEEDAALPDKYNYDTELVKNEATKIIKERLTTTPIYILIPFYIGKLVFQWGLGDFGAYDWTVPNADLTFVSSFFNSNKASVIIICNFILLIFLWKIVKKTSKKENINSFDYFFIILFAGYVLLYLITEMQARYAFIISWIFIPISLSCNLKRKSLQ